MLRIYYNQDGNAYSDFNVEKVIDDFVRVADYKNSDYQINASTENIIYAVRVAIIKGKLDFDHVALYFDETTVKFDKDARPINGNYPSTYFDNSLDTLLRIRMDKN